MSYTINRQKVLFDLAIILPRIQQPELQFKARELIRSNSEKYGWTIKQAKLGISILRSLGIKKSYRWKKTITQWTLDTSGRTQQKRGIRSGWIRRLATKRRDRMIVRWFTRKKHTASEIARHFRLTKSTIYRIISRENGGKGFYKPKKNFGNVLPEPVTSTDINDISFGKWPEKNENFESNTENDKETENESRFDTPSARIAHVDEPEYDPALGKRNAQNTGKSL